MNRNSLLTLLVVIVIAADFYSYWVHNTRLSVLELGQEIAFQEQRLQQNSMFTVGVRLQLLDARDAHSQAVMNLEYCSIVITLSEGSRWSDHGLFFQLFGRWWAANYWVAEGKKRMARLRPH